MLTLQAAEYFSLWALAAKVGISITELATSTSALVEHDLQNSAATRLLKRDSSGAQLVFSSSLQQLLVAISALAFLNILLQHVFNELYYRSFQAVWQDNLHERDFNFHENIQKGGRRRCCCFGRACLVRYFNMHEWIGLWKTKGWIIPSEHDILRDNICWVFQTFSKN